MFENTPDDKLFLVPSCGIVVKLIDAGPPVTLASHSIHEPDFDESSLVSPQDTTKSDFAATIAKLELQAHHINDTLAALQRILEISQALPVTSKRLYRSALANMQDATKTLTNSIGDNKPTFYSLPKPESIPASNTTRTR